jgi:hypothetical protein
MGFFAAIWNLYLGLLSLLGNGFLIILGIGLCGYATAQQLQPLHDPVLDSALFVAGVLLISFSFIRRIVWTFSGLVLIWCGLLWVGMTVLDPQDLRLEFSTMMLALAAGPPLLVTIILETIPKHAEPESDLEISLSPPENKDG